MKRKSSILSFIILISLIIFFLLSAGCGSPVGSTNAVSAENNMDETITESTPEDTTGLDQEQVICRNKIGFSQIL